MLVFDASAVLAALLHETGGDRVIDQMQKGLISAINACEVASRMSEHGLAAEAVMADLTAAELAVVPFDLALAVAAAALRPVTRHLGLSLGDRACLALAQSRGAAVLTADRTWADLDIGIEIQLIR